MTDMKARSVTSCMGARAVSALPGDWPAGRRETAGTGSGLFLARFLGLLAAHLLENLGVIVGAVKDGPGDKQRALLLEGEDDRIAGTRVELDDLFAQLVLHAQNDAGEKRALAGVVDDDVVELRVEPQHDAGNEVVGE